MKCTLKLKKIYYETIATGSPDVGPVVGLSGRAPAEKE